jgi:hypothetical protein
MATIGECLYRWLRLPDLNLLPKARSSIVESSLTYGCSTRPHAKIAATEYGLTKTSKI